MATKVLLVEPDCGVRSLLAEILETEGYCAVAVRSLGEAVELLSKAHFDLVVTEAFEQGNEFRFDPTFLGQLRAQAPATPIILCSLYPSTDDLLSDDYGLSEVMHKPFDVEILLTKVKKVLARGEKPSAIHIASFGEYDISIEFSWEMSGLAAVTKDMTIW